MLRRAASFALLFTVIGSVPVLASGRDDNAPPAPASTAADASASTSAAAALPAWAIRGAEKRPLALTALYGAYGTLQVLDLASTRRAIAGGAQEANPMMGGGGVGRMLAVKATAGAMSIY